MSGGNRSIDHRKLTAGIVCSVILLAGLAAGSHWHRAAKTDATASLETTLASSASAAPASTLESDPLASFPLAQRPIAISHPAKRTAAFKSSASELSSAPTPSLAISPMARARGMKTYAALSMMFEANNGQTDPRVKFLSRASGYTLFLTDKEAVLSLPSGSPASAFAKTVQHSRKSPVPQPDKLEAPRFARTVRLKFAGGKTPVAITGRDQLAGKSNYFIGNDPKQWHTNVANYSAVEYRGIYSGVDAVFRGDNRRLEFDFDIAPGANPRAIALEVEGAWRIRLNRAGDVVLSMDAARDVVMGRPRIYQQSPAGRREIAGHYVLAARNRIAFALGRYDHTQPLVIDPTLDYSTYLGGSEEDSPFAIAADSSGSAYIAGQSFSPDFPVTNGAYQTSCTQTGKTTCTPGTAYVTKLSPDGSSLVYSTFLNGHTGEDAATGIALDSSGNAYIVGYEAGETDFPTTTGAIQPVCGGGNTQPEVFVAKLNPTGSSLDYSTCLLDSIPSSSNQFSSGSSSPGGIAVDANGNAYVTGATDLPQSFPTTQGSFQTTCQQNGSEGCLVSEDPFVVKINPTGTSLLYSTFLSGGAFNSEVYTNGIAVDSLGNAYVIGEDLDTGPFPTGSPGGLLTTAGTLVPTCTNLGCGGFLAKINGNATVLVYSTYLANVSDYAIPSAVAVNQNGEAYVAGYTGATDFPTTEGALQYYFTPPGATTTNLEDGFVVEMGSLGASYEYATFLGGTASNTEATGIAIDAAGHAFVTGITGAGYPTTPDAFQTTDNAGANQVFFSELDPDGATLLYSTYLGGTTGEAFDTEPVATGVSYLATDPSGNAYVTGQTDSTDFPTTPGAFQVKSPLPSGSQSQNSTGFVAKFSLPQPVTLTLSPTTIQSGTAGTPYSPITFTAPNGHGTVTISESGSLPSGMMFSGGALSGTPMQTGNFRITISATDSQNDTGSENLTLVINCPTITVRPSTLANGMVGTVYPAVAFSEAGGVGSVTFSEAGLPTGIGMSFAAGVLSGTPTAAESFPITVTATDSNSCTGFTSDTLTINSAAPPTIVTIPTITETITVTDAPAFPDVFDQETITVADTPVVVAMPATLTTTLPVAYYSVGSLGFGTVAAGQTVTQSFSLSNIGQGGLSVSLGGISSPFSLAQTTCTNGASSLPTTLSPAGACVFTISYLAPAGAAPNGAITFTDNSPLSNVSSSGSGSTFMQSIVLNGSGTSTSPGAPPQTMVPVTDLEVITVSDTPTFPDVFDAEKITVTDIVSVTTITPTTTTLSSSANPASYRQNVVFTATVSSVLGAPAGNVSFYDGGTFLGTVALSGGTASLATTKLAVGTHAITAFYAGTTNVLSSTSAVLSESVGYPTKTTVTTSGSPSLVNQPVTFTASVTSTYGVIPDGETVTFYDGATELGTETTTAGVAALTTSALSVRTHTIKATYAGDATFKTSSGAVAQVVDPYATTTTLSTSPNPSNFGGPVQLTAVVSNTSGSNTPTGKVRFMSGTTSLATGTLNSNGTVTLGTTALPVGSDLLTAEYLGDADNGKSTSAALTQIVNPAQTMTKLTSSSNPSALGATVKLSFKVSSTTSGIPTGTVTVTAASTATGTTESCAAVSLSSGAGSCSLTFGTTGTWTLSASYSGDTNFVSSSATVTQTVTSTGYWMVTAGGAVYAFGAALYGSAGGFNLTSPVVGMAATPTGKGYWIVTAGGGVYAFGDAHFYGSASTLTSAVVGVSATPTGKGYWMVTADGGLFTFGDARSYGSVSALGFNLTSPVVGMSATPTGNGYWMVAADGGLFTFGDAHFYGSAGGVTLASPVVGMSATPTGKGYWMVTADGGLFTFGDAHFYGSAGGFNLASPVVGMSPN